jgi:serine/threonine protein kinase
MDILSYHQNNRCIARFNLQQDAKIYTIGSSADNDFVIAHPQVAPQQLQIQFDNGIYHFLAVAENGTMLEAFTLPVDCWLDLPENKKIWLNREQSAGYLLFRSKVAAPLPKNQKNTADSNPAMTGGKARTTNGLSDIPAKMAEKNVAAEPANDIGKASAAGRKKTGKNPAANPDLQTTDSEEAAVTNLWQQEQPTIVPVADAGELNLAPEPSWEQDTLLYETRKKNDGKLDVDKISSFAGRYTVIGLLGKGGMGIVYKVRDEKMNRIVALKLLIVKDKETLELIQRFLSEARTIAKLHHSNVVAVHDIGMHEGMPYFTMDFIDGKELHKCLNDVKPRQAMQWMLVLCDAVNYIHECGVIHRDLKPSNVMLQGNQPILMDFGIARDETTHSVLTVAGKSIGTPVYMSPEQARGQTSQINVQSDVYGLGAIFYEMLTKQPPFAGTPIQVIYKVCNIEPTPIATLNPGIPKDIITIVSKAMCKDKSFRYASAKEMGKDIQRYLQGLCIHAKPLTLSQHLVKLFRQNRNVSYGVLGGAALLILMLGTFFYSRYTAAATRQHKISEQMQTAAQHLEAAKTLNSDTITHYIQASENYTRVLGLDSSNAEAQNGKFETLLQIAQHASLVLHDYNFARTMYSSAQQMGINDQRVKAELEIMQKKEKEEKLAVHNMLNKIFAQLREQK